MKDATDIAVVLDRSGSMQNIQHDTEGGFNTFVKEQKEQPGEAKLSLYQFDDKYEVVYENMDLNNVPALSLIPRGYTALLDAVGKTIQSRGEYYASLAEEDRPERIVFVIITDGEENHSTEYTLDAVKSLITLQKETYKWQFVFLGADINSVAVGSSMGISKGSTMDFAKSPVGVANTYSNLSKNISSYRSCASREVSFSDADRIDSMKTDN